jgi:predicted PurR-regulated permease PerM
VSIGVKRNGSPTNPPSARPLAPLISWRCLGFAESLRRWTPPGAGCRLTRVADQPGQRKTAGSDRPEPEWTRRWPPMSYVARAALVVLIVASIYHAAADVSETLVLVVIAIVIAVGLDPAVRFLVHIGMRRGLAVATIFLAAGLFLLLFALLVGPPLVGQIGGLADDVPRYAADLSRRSDWIGRYLREHDVAAEVQGFLADIPSKVAASFGTIVGVAGRIGSGIFQLATVAILSIYFSLSLERMRRAAALLFTPDRREQGELVLDRTVEKIGGYVGGNLATSGVCTALALIFLLIAGVPFAVPLALWAGIADLIPQFGSYLGAAPAVIVALFQSPALGLIVLVYFIAYQQFENYWLVPRVMRDAVDLSPAAVIISTLIGGGLLGFAGALLALPVAATLKVVIQEVWLRDRIASGDRLVQQSVEEDRRKAAEDEAERTVRAEARRRRWGREKKRDGGQPG